LHVALQLGSAIGVVLPLTKRQNTARQVKLFLLKLEANGEINLKSKLSCFCG
jgi:hypothetical protein